MATSTAPLKRVQPTSSKIAAPTDSDDSDDMFDLASDTDSPSKKRQKTETDKNKKGANKGQKLDQKLLDKWDDEENYYKTIIGEVLNDKYKVVDHLGKGVSATVVKVEEVQEGEEEDKDHKNGNGNGKGNGHSNGHENDGLAVKIIRSNDAMRKIGDREGRIIELLNNHQTTNSIIGLIDRFDHKGHLCLVFEGMHSNLRDILKEFGRNQGINIRAVRLYARQIFTSLKILRECHILHGDFKPDNVLVNAKRSSTRLCDFGSAVEANKDQKTWTEPMPYLASRFYRAPELILGAPFDYGVDMWSAGCTLYELYTGCILFAGSSNNHMIKCIMDVRGKFSHKQLKKGKFSDKYFDENLDFKSEEVDSHTGRLITHTLRYTQNQAPLPVKKLLGKCRETGSDIILQGHLIDLLDKLFTLNPEKRITPEQALEHPFCQDREADLPGHHDQDNHNNNNNHNPHNDNHKA